MSSTKRNVGFRTAVGASARSARSGSPPGVPMGYSSPGESDSQSVQGDDQFPFIKDPPDLGLAVVYRTNANWLAASTDLSDLEVLPSIDVRGARALTLYLSYLGYDAEVDANAPTVAIVPESAVIFEGTGAAAQWFFYGVINPVLYGSGLYGASALSSLEANSTAFRDSFVSQINFTPDGATPRNMMYVFDVQEMAEVRFRIGCVERTTPSEDGPSVTARATLHYQLQR